MLGGHRKLGGVDSCFELFGGAAGSDSVFYRSTSECGSSSRPPALTSKNTGSHVIVCLVTINLFTNNC